MTKLISSIKKSLALLAALLLSASAAYAAPSPIDTAAPCTLTLVCTYSGAPLSSVQVRLYRAADADAHMRFALTGAFAASGVSLDGLTDAAAFSRTASVLAEYAAENKLTPEYTAAAAADGRLTFSALTPGLYLVVVNPFSAASGTYSAAPFLAALPEADPAGNAWMYSVSVSPKIEYKPTPTPAPTVQPYPPYPIYDRLPQTGQLRWPVPVLAVTGLALAALGVWLMRRKTHDR